VMKMVSVAWGTGEDGGEGGSVASVILSL